MALLIAIVFLGVFALAALLMVTSGALTQGGKGTTTPGASRANANPELSSTPPDFRKSELLSGIPWLNRWLLKMELAPRMRLLLYQANLKWTTGRLLLTCASCFALPASLIEMRTGSTLLSLCIGLALGFSPFALVFFKRGQRFASFEKELPEALDLMVSALRAGHSLNAALGLVARECQEPVRSEFRICFDEQNYGLEVRNAMENMTVRTPLADLKIATTAILIQKETGGNLAEVLNKTSEVIRERFRLKRQIRVHTAHGRMTGWVISIIPMVLLVILYLLNPDLESLLWKRELGVKLLYGAAGMMAFGGLIIRKIIRIDV
jgi:tight adherence protein B